MKKLLLGVAYLASMLMPAWVMAQETEQFNEPCLTEYMFREYAKKDPSLIQKRAAMDAEVDRLVQKRKQSRTTAGDVRIIPVVFHVIYENACGPENISLEQIEDQIRVMNEDYRRLNPDTTKTPSGFLDRAADVNVEFRLAKKDPNGNCTEGVVRLQSALTNNARDNVKALSYWDSKKYLNIWVVKNITGATPPSYILGFAQFPGGSATTDGVVLRADVVGTIGYAKAGLFPNNKGRTATHEVGHWLNLRHIWGDSNCGNDMVDDTPTHTTSNAGCPTYPKTNTCTQNASNDPAKGEMFTDYMDYTNGECQNMFSTGQSARMNATLDGPRSVVASSANLIATGVGQPSLCVPKADFCYTTTALCVGASASFTDKSYKGQVSSYKWYLPGSDTPISTDASPTVIYNSPGKYSVTLVVKNAQGSDSLAKTDLINVLPTNAQYAAPFADAFEQAPFTGSGWYRNNRDGDAVTWTNDATVSANNGKGSVKLNNFDNTGAGKVDEFISPTVDLSSLTNPTFTFYTAYVYKSTTTPTDALRVYSSENCGRTWTVRRTILPAEMRSSTTNVATSFSPTADQWKKQTISLASLQGKSNIAFRFEFTSGTGGNNLYLDNVNVAEAVSGIEELDPAKYNVSIVPNPTAGQAMINYELDQAKEVSIELLDITGRMVATLVSKQTQAAGQHNISTSQLNAGVYFVKLQIGQQVLNQKLIVN